MQELEQLYRSIVEGDAPAALAEVERALARNVQPVDLIGTCMIPAMDEVGRRFQSDEYFVPDLLMAGRAMKGCVERLRPLLAAAGVQPVGRVVIGTVRGDLHDIGKNLVASMLEGGGFEVTDLGIDVSPERFVEAVRSKAPNIVALSALLTVTLPAMKTTVEALRHAGLRERVRIMVGGAPVTAGYSAEIGADAYSENAADAVAIARQLVGAA
jgi:5-methyltetrahydrofolate--homocysteine methyltransferase